MLRKLEDIIDPLHKVWEKIPYRNIDAKNKINVHIHKKTLIHEFDEHIDDCILHTLHAYENMTLFIFFGKSKDDAYRFFIETFSKKYIVYGIKHINIIFSCIRAIMYQLLFERISISSKQQIISYLEKEIPFLHSYTKSNIDITVLYIRKRNEFLLDSIEKEIHQKEMYVYIPQTKKEKWNSACVFFSRTTMAFLQMQNIDFFWSPERTESHRMFLMYKKWLECNISPEYQSQFMLYSSVVLYLLGHRSMNDLDLYIHTIPKEIIEKVNEWKGDRSYSFIEYNIKHTEKWPHYWNIWLDEWARTCGAQYFEEILGNPCYHFYFLGVKIISLSCDIQRRLLRNRPRATADLIALRKRYSYPILIPPIPEISYEYKKKEKMTKEEINEAFQKGAIELIETKELKIPFRTDISKYIHTVIYALHERYNMTFLPDEIKKELHMISNSSKKIVIRKK